MNNSLYYFILRGCWMLRSDWLMNNLRRTIFLRETQPIKYLLLFYKHHTQIWLAVWQYVNTACLAYLSWQAGVRHSKLRSAALCTGGTAAFRLFHKHQRANFPSACLLFLCRPLQKNSFNLLKKKKANMHSHKLNNSDKVSRIIHNI